MRGLLVLILALVAPMEILSRWKQRTLDSWCSERVDVPQFSKTHQKCGYSFPALEATLADEKMSNWQKVEKIAHIINIPWAYKIPAEAYDCYWNMLMKQHSQLISQIINYYGCVRDRMEINKLNKSLYDYGPPEPSCTHYHLCHKHKIGS